jgi:hypothetical protein
MDPATNLNQLQLRLWTLWATASSTSPQDEPKHGCFSLAGEGAFAGRSRWVNHEALGMAADAERRQVGK